MVSVDRNTLITQIVSLNPQLKPDELRKLSDAQLQAKLSQCIAGNKQDKNIDSVRINNSSSEASKTPKMTTEEAQDNAIENIKVRVDTVYVNLDAHEYFKVGSAKVLSQASIRTLARSMDNTKHYIVVGYASEEGSKAFNEKLSRRRAETVYNLLVKFGFPAENLEYKGEGPTTKFSTNDKNANRVVVVKQK